MIFHVHHMLIAHKLHIFKPIMKVITCKIEEKNKIK